ncbi:MAG: MtrB/PioB family outer membrane beta-barrel protein [Usitatibacter sp.]
MRRKLLAVLVANVVGAGPALAEGDDFILSGSVGAGGISVNDHDARDASKMFEYRDLSNGVLSLFDVKGRGRLYWLDIFGENLGRDDQYVDFRGGMYDRFKYRLYSDALRHNFLFNGLTPYQGAGSATQVASLPSPNPAAWGPLDIGYRRRNDGVLFEYQGAAPWYARVEANQVRWKGSKPGSAAQGTSPGNGFVDLSFPVDYRTRNVTFEGGYDSRTAHYDLSYMLSRFDNDNESVTWTNGYFGGIDRTYLAPDNRYMRLAGNATFRHLPLGSTFAMRFTRDELTSSALLGTSVLNNGGVMAATGPDSQDYRGKVRNDTFTLALASAPMAKVDVRAHYNYRRRADDSSEVAFSSAAIAGPFANERYSYRKNDVGVDAAYRVNRSNRLGAGIGSLDTQREGRFDFDHTRDRTWFAEWKNSSLDDLGVRFKYMRLERRSDFLLGSEGTGTGDAAYLNRFVTAFDLSNVDQDRWKLTLDYTPLPMLDLAFEGILKNNRYKDNVLGRQKDNRSEYYVSASYGEPTGVRFTVFADAEDIRYDSQHRILSFGSTTVGTYDPLSPPSASAYNWSGRIKDRNWAAGISASWPATLKLLVTASAIYYKTDGSVDLALQEGTPSSVAPPGSIASWDDSKRTSLNLKAAYAYSKAWKFTGGVAYEKYSYTDLQVDGYRNTIPASGNATSYLSGVYANPQYRASIIYAMVSYLF